MAKIRVYELAKQLGIQSKDIVEFLAANGVADKTQSSGLDENHVEMVQKKFKKAPAPEKKEQPVNHEAPQKEEKAQAEGQKERPKKKSSISAVYNAQYSRQPRPRKDGVLSFPPGRQTCPSQKRWGKTFPSGRSSCAS